MEMLFAAITWDANPILVELGPIAVRWYSLLFAAGFLVGLLIVKRMFKEENAPDEWLDKAFVYIVLGAVIGARLGHCIFYDWDYFSQHPLEIFLPVRFEPEFRFTGFSGLASHGGAIGVILAIWLFSKQVSKKPMLWILDKIAVPSALAGAFIRLGNLMNSEIIGKPSDASWAFIFKKVDDVARHPVQLYEAIAYIITFIILYFTYWKTDKRHKLGYVTGLFLVFVWGARFVLEYFKRSQGGIESWIGQALSTGQMLSIPFILIGLYFIFRKAPQQA